MISNSKENLKEYFTKSCKIFKEFGKYKHLLFTTGLEDDVSFDMFSDATFNIDPNIGESTADAIRLCIILYLYHFPNVNFNIELLNNDVNSDIFTFSNNRFHPKFLNIVDLYIDKNKEFIIPFVPKIGSSHWYTLCIQPEKNRIVILNPLSDTGNEEKKLLYDICYTLFDELELNNVNIIIENAGIQTSCMSCGESSLMICLAIITNGEEGYTNLINHLKSDHIVNGIYDIYNISLNKKCFCCNCVGNDYCTFNIMKKKYKYCVLCAKKYGRSIGLNDENSEKCVFCATVFDDNTHIIIQKKTYNKYNTEINIRNDILCSVENEDIESIKKGCDLREKYDKLQKEYDQLKKQFDKLTKTINT